MRIERCSRIKENTSTLITSRESRPTLSTPVLSKSFPSLQQVYPPAASTVTPRGSSRIASRIFFDFQRTSSRRRSCQQREHRRPCRELWSRNIPVYLVNRSVLRPDAAASGLAALGLHSAERGSALRPLTCGDISLQACAPSWSSQTSSGGPRSSQGAARTAPISPPPCPPFPPFRLTWRLQYHQTEQRPPAGQ